MSASFFAAMMAICFFCFLFSFFINCPFASSCRASRDQANDVLSAHRKHHEEDGSGIDGGQHNKAAFLIAVQLVPHGQREWSSKASEAVWKSIPYLARFAWLFLSSHSKAISHYGKRKYICQYNIRGF